MKDTINGLLDDLENELDNDLSEIDTYDLNEILRRLYPVISNKVYEEVLRRN